MKAHINQVKGWLCYGRISARKVHKETPSYCKGGRALAQVPRGVVESPPLEVFGSCLEMVLGSRLGVSLLEQGLDQGISRAPFPSQAVCGSLQLGIICVGVFPLFLVADATARCFPALAEGDCLLLSSPFCDKSLFPFYLLFCYGHRPFPNALQNDFGPGAETCACFPENLRKNMHVVCQLKNVSKSSEGFLMCFTSVTKLKPPSQASSSVLVFVCLLFC